MTSYDLAKPGTNTEATVKHTSNQRNILKAVSVHENTKINDKHSDENLQRNNL